jgi:hypothetical protein
LDGGGSTSARVLKPHWSIMRAEAARMTTSVQTDEANRFGRPSLVDDEAEVNLVHDTGPMGCSMPEIQRSLFLSGHERNVALIMLRRRNRSNSSNGSSEDPRLKIIYDEAVRGWSLQSSVLDELRSRTGVLLAAASVSAALLGSADLTKHSKLSPVGVGAVVAFGLVIFLCCCVLWPTGGWEFTHDAEKLLAGYIQPELSLDNTYTNLALKADECRKNNNNKLKRQFCAFRWAAFALGVSIVLWLIDLNR